MKTTINPKTPQQVRHLFALFRQLGIDTENRGDIVFSFTDGRTSSVADLEFIEAQTLIRKLTELTRKGFQKRHDTDDLDRKRKGVIKAIFRYLELKGTPANIDYVKAIACRAADRKFFNELSMADLTRVYNEFCRKQHAINVINNEINHLSKLN